MEPNEIRATFERLVAEHAANPCRERPACAFCWYAQIVKSVGPVTGPHLLEPHWPTWRMEKAIVQALARKLTGRLPNG